MKQLIECVSSEYFLFIMIPSAILFLISVSVVDSFFQKSYAVDSSCLDFIPSNITIRVTCGSATLSEIYQATKDKTTMGDLNMYLEKESNNGNWLLQSNLVIGKNASFTINSNDTRWVKIYSDGKQAYSIMVYGNMIIDSVKITSWNPQENDYFYPIKKDSSDIRAYISVMDDAIGTTNITSSELAFLGYNSSLGKHTPSNGLSYYGGEGSIIRNNNIHNNNFGFYSARVGGLLIEDNDIHHNTFYGMDPHSGTYDIIIRNNTVHDNGKMGIICSQHCRNITIENNNVHHNAGSGISFSIDMQNSIVRNNYIYNQAVSGISVSESDNNKIYGNSISFSKIGLKIINNSSNNYVYNNSISGTNDYAILVRDRTSVNNTLENNDIDSSKKGVRVENTSGTLFRNNDQQDTTSFNQEYVLEKNSTLNFEKTTFPNWTSIISDKSNNNVINVDDSGKISVKSTRVNNITNFDTNKIPLRSGIYNETISIISRN